MTLGRVIIAIIAMIGLSSCALTKYGSKTPEDKLADSIRLCREKQNDWDYEHNYCKYNPYKNAGDSQWKEPLPPLSKKEKKDLPPHLQH